MESSYVFVLGRTPMLAQAEIAAVYPDLVFTEISSHIIQTGSLATSAENIVNRLGGVVKIGKVIHRIPSLSAEPLAAAILSLTTNSSVTFAVSSLIGTFPRSVLSQIKAILLENGVETARFIEAKQGGLLNGGQVKEKNLIELLVVLVENELLVTHVIASQAVDSWSKRDYDRPYADPKRGMLPPKVARMVVNIALGKEPKEKVILDPFCGMGTILAEGYMIGAIGTGVDLDGKAVTEATENMNWITKAYPSDIPVPKIIQGDAVHVSRILPKESVDAVITEPFLGNPSFAVRTDVSNLEVQNTIKGLEKLYIGCLKDWNSVLKPHGIVVIALPAFIRQGHKHIVKKVVDSCENFGYSMSQGPLEYARPQAVIQREFFVFHKKG